MTKCYAKICKNCGSKDTKKDGTRRGKQSYKCKFCKYVWISKSRQKPENIEHLYHEYAVHKQTYGELSAKMGISCKTVQRKLDSYSIPSTSIIGKRNIILLIDTTYFGSLGLMVFKDAIKKQILHYQIVAYETNQGYKDGIKRLQEQGRTIKAIVCDGRRGLLGGFKDIPTQMCHFHQQQIIRRYITKKPKLAANIELKKIVDWLPNCDESVFRKELDDRYVKHENFLKEQGIKSNGKKYYIHRKTRSAYYSLKRNLEFLFIYERYWGILDIPNTTNGLEGVFSHLKYKVHLHRGLRSDRKIKLISYLLQN